MTDTLPEHGVTGRGPIPIQHTNSLYIGGRWVRPSSDAVFPIIDPATEENFYSVPEAQAADLSAAIEAARQAFDEGPWPLMSPRERAGYLRTIGDLLRTRAPEAALLWPRESGVIYSSAQAAVQYVPKLWDINADLAETFPFEQPVELTTTDDHAGTLLREPVGVVGAILAWNDPLLMMGMKVAPALLAGCTVVVKAAPEAPGNAYLMAEIAEAANLPPGVLNVVTAGREVSESLVKDPRVDKISFTGSTATGRRIGALCGERIARFTLELGGKGAAVILDDADLEQTARTLAARACFLSGQVCSSLTRLIVPRNRHDEFVDALSAELSQVSVGDPFEPATGLGPLVAQRQLTRVLGYIDKGKSEGAQLALGGGRPRDLSHGWFVEPTVFGNVDNSSTIAREEIFGPVLSVIPARDDTEAIRLANDTPYGLNASVFTSDAARAGSVARRLRSGTVGQNDQHGDVGVAFGGFKQSGIGREGGEEGLRNYLETKLVILNR